MALESMPAALAARAARLHGEIRRLEGASAVKRLQRALGYYLDQAAWDEAAELFAADATIEVGLDGVYRGRERIRQYFHALGGGRRGLAHGELHEWFLVQPVVSMSPDGRTARARWRAFLMAGRLGAGAVWGEGPIEARYVRGSASADGGRAVRREDAAAAPADAAADGVWRIESLHLYQTFVVPYEGGWTRSADLTGGRLGSRSLAPDAPPTETYEVWPGVHTPPFHYASPIETLHWSSEAAAPGSDLSGAGERASEAPLARAVTALEQRVLLLHDAAQIENLVSAYGYYLDKQQWDALAALFAEDATMEISQRGVYVGRESIRRALELFGPQGIERGHVHNHMQLQPIIHVAADRRRAWVRSRAFSQLGVYQTSGIWHGGLYENELVNQDGVWRFQKDHVYTTYFAHYESGWMSGPRPTPKPSERIPPDRPATERYESFPEVYIPPFHYRHPVTGRAIELPQAPAGTASAGESAGLRSAALEDPSAIYEGLEVHAARSDSASGAGAADNLSRMAARVLRLEDERAIESLQRSYGYFVDKALWQEAADLFAEDGTLEIGGRGVFVGKARVLDYLRWLEPRGLARNKLFEHMQLQPVVTLAPNGASAQGRWRFFAQVGEYGKFAIWGVGTYENEYVKEGGVWKIKTLHSYFRMYASYADGWGKSALPNTRPEKDLPPDRPPTVVHDSYPGTFIPPCHFPHPVTGK